LLPPGSSVLLVAFAVLVTSSGLSVGSLVGEVGRGALHVGPSLSTSGVSPPPTTGAGAAFDTSDGYLLMFGGLDSGTSVVGWTWSFVHNNWTDLTSAVGAAPSARWGEGLAYDALDGYVVLFGGCFNIYCSSVSNDTWIYAHDRWTNLSSGLSTTPPARGRTMMTYDAYDQYVPLFGGTGSAESTLNDEWAFSGGHWTAVGNLSSPRPAPRTGAAIAYDPETGSAILFGGFSPSTTFGDTWSYQNGTWTNLTAGSPLAPSPRRLPMMAYDGADGYLMLVNGYSGSSYLGDEWSFSSDTWSPLVHHGGPEASFGGVLAYDPVDRYVVYFSGAVSGGVLTSTLVYAGGNWTLLINPTTSNLAALVLVLVTVVVLGAMIGLVAVFASRVRRRQEGKLGEGFVLAPGELPTWVPTGAALRSRYFQQVLPIVVMLVVFLPFLGLVLLSGGGAGAGLFAAFLGLLLLLLVAMVVWVAPRQTIRTIGIVRSGLILSRKGGELRLPWSQLQPGVMPPRRGWFWFQYTMPGKSVAFGGFAATVEQARTILSSPLAPPWVLTEAVASGLGLPSRAVGPALSASAGAGTYAPRFPSPGQGPAPLPGSVPTSTPLPSQGPPATGYYGPPPLGAPAPWAPGPTAPSSPPPSPVAARPPPGMRPCPSCGQLNAVGRVAFCTACGTRL